MKTGSYSDYAAHIGRSPAYVNKLKGQGRLVMVDVDGKQRVNFDASDRLVRNTTDLGRAGNGRNAGGNGGGPASLESPAGAGGGGQFDVLFRKAQTQDRVFTAKIREVEYQELVGQLVRSADVVNVLAALLVTTREALMQLPARIAPGLAVESDPAQVQNTLEAEIHAALTALASADIPAALAARRRAAIGTGASAKA